MLYGYACINIYYIYITVSRSFQIFCGLYHLYTQLLLFIVCFKFLAISQQCQSHNLCRVALNFTFNVYRQYRRPNCHLHKSNTVYLLPDISKDVLDVNVFRCYNLCNKVLLLYPSLSIIIHLVLYLAALSPHIFAASSHAFQLSINFLNVNTTKHNYLQKKITALQ